MEEVYIIVCSKTMIVLYGNYCNQAEKKALVGVAVACKMADHLIYLTFTCLDGYLKYDLSMHMVLSEGGWTL